MKARVRTAALAGAALVSGGAALAAEPVSEHSASAAVLATLADVDDAEPVTARAALRLQYGLLFDNQIEAGFGVGAAAERDDPRRDPRGGRVGDCPAAAPGCPAIGGAPLRGPVSGFYADGAPANEGGRLKLETAYAYVRGGWGEASLGRDEGAGRRFSLLPPTILAIGGAIDAPVDGTGLGGVVLANDVSGQSAKVFVSTTRILGLQAGASWTPRIEHRGLDQGFRKTPALAAFEPENVVEAGLSFAHDLAGWEVAAGATYARAEDRNGGPAFDAMDAWTGGVTLARNGWRAGFAWQANDNGGNSQARGYAAAGASIVRDNGRWSAMLELAGSSDDLTFVDTRSATLALRRSLGERFALAGGANWRDRSSPISGGPSRAGRQERDFGGFMEISYAL